MQHTLSSVATPLEAERGGFEPPTTPAGVGGVAVFEADKKGILKHLLRAAVLLDEIKEDFYFTGASLRALIAVFVALAPIGRLLGYGHGYRTDDDQAAGVRSCEGRGVPSAAVVGCVAVALFEDVHNGLPDGSLVHEPLTLGLGDADEASRQRSLLTILLYEILFG